jgi:FtsH-binding integral membrane protein
MHGPGFISIWFFIGMLLTAYGLLITATGLYELGAPPANPPVLFNLHASIWWGLVLLLIGLVYFIRFFPKKTR